MNTLTYSEARAGFKQAMDDVCRDHTPMLITRQGGEHVVMVSLEDFCAMQETLYLLSSPKNAERLMQALAESKKRDKRAIPGRSAGESLKELRRSLGLDSTSGARD